jgi:D-alanyl-lipoteichoic acid acyltransferase DltB (MBOAT superfamily)
MIFNSLTFVVFFAIVLGVHNLPLRWTVKKSNLLIASYLFYAAWNPPFVILIWISTSVDWIVARRMAAAKTKRSRKLFLLASLTTNLGMLGYFKYGTFLLENFVALLQSVGIEFTPAAPDIVLPIGISFYTFQTLSYTIDVYRGRLSPCRSRLDFALFVTYFPQLVAGPIVRASEFLPQLLEPQRPTGRVFSWGLVLLIVGLFEKVILADSVLSPVSEMVFAAPAKAGMVDAWLGVFAFAGQVFFDFSGYSTCAIGIALCFGFALPDNFRFPYSAVGFSDFWKRWHVSLSTWLRDYIYISLGGSHKGLGRTYVNAMITMLLAGLWHGAGWTFVAFGALHGFYLVMTRYVKVMIGGFKWIQTEPVRFAMGVVTFIMMCFSYAVFRATDFTGVWQLWTAMVTVSKGSMFIGLANALNVAAITMCMLLFHWHMRNRTLEDLARAAPWWLRSAVIAFMLFWLINETGGGRAFVYFQF